MRVEKYNAQIFSGELNFRAKSNSSLGVLLSHKPLEHKHAHGQFTPSNVSNIVGIPIQHLSPLLLREGSKSQNLIPKTINFASISAVRCYYLRELPCLGVWPHLPHLISLRTGGRGFGRWRLGNSRRRSGQWMRCLFHFLGLLLTPLGCQPAMALLWSPRRRSFKNLLWRKTLREIHAWWNRQ